MQVATFVTSMIARLGNRDDMEDTILAVADELLSSTLENRGWFPWFLATDTETEGDTFQTVAEQESVVLPTGYLSQVPDSDVWITDSNGKRRLKQLFYVDMLEMYDTTDIPMAVNNTGTRLRIRGIPAEVYPLVLYYYKTAGPFSGQTSNPWLTYAGNVVIGEVGAVIAGQYLQDPQLAQMFAQLAAKAWSELSIQTTAKQLEGMDLVKGGE